jgi:hypothetical protein
LFCFDIFFLTSIVWEFLENMESGGLQRISGRKIPMNGDGISVMEREK